METRAIVEALLFVAEEPLTAGEVAQLTETSVAQIEELMQTMARELSEDPTRGVVLKQIAGGWRLYTDPDMRPYLERFAASDRAARLSSAALETLAVVAYQQPVSRGQVSEVRGVDSERALQTLERRGLIFEIGRAPGPGQAVLYGTTDLFLERLGVNSLADLPPLADHVPPAGIVDALERPFRPESTSSESIS
ncbi:MAG: SMC-Scp complex subunit ScpB [Acidimicrobiia bacterium]|nr:SMC-Scp complex subunit ScpB [Acidimicrobiia bacterium]